MIGAGALRPSAITAAQTISLVFPFAAVAVHDPRAHALILVAAVVAALGADALFGLMRRRVPAFHGITTALIFATLCPPDIALWQVLVAVTLGAVLGELVFGGRGFGFLAPATVAFAVLIISFPQVQLSPPSQSVALATLPGGVLLWYLGLVSGRVLLATSLGLGAILALQGHVPDPAVMATAIAFGAVFLIADPVAAAATNAGRLIYGALAGALIAVFSPTAEITQQAVIFAALMAGIFAPLIDHLVVLTHGIRWRRRHDV